MTKEEKVKAIGFLNNTGAFLITKSGARVCKYFGISKYTLENLLGSTWQLTGGIATSISPTGKELISVSGSGELTQKAYWGCYEESQRQLKECICDQSYIKFQSALILGIAAIEAYINYRVSLWNEAHPQERLVASKKNKVSFDQKVDNWIPTMTNRKNFDKGTRNWQDFKYLRDIRDNTTIHMINSY